MKEAFQKQLRGSKKHPKDGLFQYGPCPSGPVFGLQTAGLLQGLGWEAAGGPGWSLGSGANRPWATCFTSLTCKMGPIVSIS